jgi:hypothetical protein
MTTKQNDQDQAKLREAGFDPDAPPEAAVATLRSMRGKPGIDEAAIARALGNLKIAEAADLLAEMESGASGVLRREVRRALFKLRQHGIEPTRVSMPEAPRVAALGDTGLSGVISGFDPEGGRIAWLVKPRAQGGIHFLWALLSDTEGLTAVRANVVSRRELRDQRRELEEHSGVKTVDADWRLVDYIMCEAYRRTPEAHRGAVGSFLMLRAEFVASSPSSEFIHPIYNEALAEPAEPSLDLLKEPEVSSWKLSADDLKPYVDEIAEMEQSPLVLNEVQQRERVDQIVARAIGDLFAGERAVRARRRLEDTAYFFARTGRRDAARSAAAAAAAVRDGTDLRRLAFFGNFVRGQLIGMFALKREQEKQEPRLILTPAEAIRAQQSRARER